MTGISAKIPSKAKEPMTREDATSFMFVIVARLAPALQYTKLAGTIPTIVAKKNVLNGICVRLAPRFMRKKGKMGISLKKRR